MKLIVGNRYRMLVANSTESYIVIFTGMAESLSSRGMACVTLGNTRMLCNPTYLYPVR